MVINGYVVMITGRRIERLEEIKAENPESYITQQHDITDLEATDLLFEKLHTTFDTVDLIVHNSEHHFIRYGNFACSNFGFMRLKASDWVMFNRLA